MKKNLTKVTIFLSMLLLTLIPLSVNAMSGNGTEESPFIITSEEELLLVTDFPDSHFKLGNDIVMTKKLEIPLCYESESQTFSGVFDGDGHSISNLVIDSYIGHSGAPFHANDGIITNLNISIKSVRCSNGSGIANTNNGTISNCSVIWNETDSTAYSSGIAWSNDGIIKNCEVFFEITASYGHWAGIASYNDETGIISQCKVEGNYFGDHNNEAAGICLQNGNIINECYFIGNLTANAVSGICIKNSNYDHATIEIKNCYFIGSLTGDTLAGICLQNGYYGSPSYFYTGTIKNCYVASTFDYTTNIYPITNNIEKSESIVENCYYDKTIAGLTIATYGTPKSTTAMKMLQTYQNTWDFDNVWGIDENINNGSPYLLWEYAPTDNQIAFDTETQKAKIYLKEAGTYTVIFADYNGTTFVEADIQPLTLKQGYNNIPTTLTLTDGDKVFMWKDLKTLVPICGAANVSSK